MILTNEQIKLLQAVNNNILGITKQFASIGTTLEKVLEDVEANNQLKLELEPVKVTPKEPMKEEQNVNIKFLFVDDLGTEIFNGAYDNNNFVPIKGSDYAAAFDLRAYIYPDTSHNIIGSKILHPGETYLFKTNLKIEVPEGYELNPCSRSGLASKGVIVANAPGIIDPDYRGEVMIILHNQSGLPVIINHGDRIAQCKLNKIIPTVWVKVAELSSTERGEAGLGSTGNK